jgi:hypothetical protein
LEFLFRSETPNLIWSSTPAPPPADVQWSRGAARAQVVSRDRRPSGRRMHLSPARECRTECLHASFHRAQLLSLVTVSIHRLQQSIRSVVRHRSIHASKARFFFLRVSRTPRMSECTPALFALFAVPHIIRGWQRPKVTSRVGPGRSKAIPPSGRVQVRCLSRTRHRPCAAHPAPPRFPSPSRRSDRTTQGALQETDGGVGGGRHARARRPVRRADGRRGLAHVAAAVPPPPGHARVDRTNPVHTSQLFSACAETLRTNVETVDSKVRNVVPTVTNHEHKFPITRRPARIDLDRGCLPDCRRHASECARAASRFAHRRAAPHRGSTRTSTASRVKQQQQQQQKQQQQKHQQQQQQQQQQRAAGRGGRGDPRSRSRARRRRPSLR